MIATYQLLVEKRLTQIKASFLLLIIDQKIDLNSNRLEEQLKKIDLFSPYINKNLCTDFKVSYAKMIKCAQNSREIPKITNFKSERTLTCLTFDYHSRVSFHFRERNDMHKNSNRLFYSAFYI